MSQALLPASALRTQRYGLERPAQGGRRATLAEMAAASPYHAYLYAYPHKTAYRSLEPAVALDSLWAPEPRDSLSLYAHVPFCEMRCGFCNLFTQVSRDSELHDRYLDALERQTGTVRSALGKASFARFAVGGGTPTLLDAGRLERLLGGLQRGFGFEIKDLPSSIETSPETATEERIRLIVDHGFSRVSIGVQSFIEAETRAVLRPQDPAVALQALERLAAAAIPTRNIDLMYGLPGQTLASWLYSIETALRFAPEELYLYPLYVRPVTGLGRKERAWPDLRLELYRHARERLLSCGYAQVSMRMFRLASAPEVSGPEYCCQSDGMIGVGCGARSYTSGLHYSEDWAVSGPAVKDILAAYSGRTAADFALARHGYRLDAEDQRRRHLVQSLLQREGLSPLDYEARFGAAPEAHFPELAELDTLGFVAIEDDRTGSRGRRLCPTAAGLEMADCIGPWLVSEQVRRLSAELALR